MRKGKGKELISELPHKLTSEPTTLSRLARAHARCGTPRPLPFPSSTHIISHKLYPYNHNTQHTTHNTHTHAVRQHTSLTYTHRIARTHALLHIRRTTRDCASLAISGKSSITRGREDQCQSAIERERTIDAPPCYKRFRRYKVFWVLLGVFFGVKALKRQGQAGRAI